MHFVKEEEPKETTRDLLEALKASVTKSGDPGSKQK
jgi:non-homologous end joining protein Ku